MTMKTYYKDNQNRFAEDLFEMIRYDLTKILEFLKNDKCMEYDNQAEQYSYMYPDRRNKIAAEMIQKLIKNMR